MTAKNENMVVLNLSQVEAFGFSGLNKAQFESLLANAIKCDLVIHDCSGKQYKLEIMQQVKVDNITITDEDGYEIESADELNV